MNQSNKFALREWRLHYDLTLQELAEGCGVTYATLSRIERGICNPSYLTRHRIERFFEELEKKNNELQDSEANS